LMPAPILWAVTVATMVAFAANSLLCRQALGSTEVDPASFTLIRLLSGALVLALIARVRGGGIGSGNWKSGLALFGYAAGFSFAYLSLSAGTGALLLFGSVHLSMIGYGLLRGERMARWQWMGMLLALLGFVFLMAPGVTAPPMTGALLMIVAGLSWAVYSIRGRKAADPTLVTAGNFVWAVPFAAALSLLFWSSRSLDPAGVMLAVASGAVASGLGYVMWYALMLQIKSTEAATVQLGVPPIAALGGILLLGESLTPRLVVASIAILGGVALVVRARRA
jgi:drug/metabolite transporter (DMT)-like permease